MKWGHMEFDFFLSRNKLATDNLNLDSSSYMVMVDLIYKVVSAAQASGPLLRASQKRPSS